MGLVCFTVKLQKSCNYASFLTRTFLGQQGGCGARVYINLKEVFSDVVVASNAHTLLRAQRFLAALKRRLQHVTKAPKGAQQTPIPTQCIATERGEGRESWRLSVLQ